MDEDVPLHNEKVRRDQQYDYVINHYIHNKIEEFCQIFYSLIFTQHDDGAAHFGTNEDFGHEDPNSHASLEDLCRSHLVSTEFVDFATETLQIVYTIISVGANLISLRIQSVSQEF